MEGAICLESFPLSVMKLHWLLEHYSGSHQQGMAKMEGEAFWAGEDKAGESRFLKRVSRVRMRGGKS